MNEYVVGLDGGGTKTTMEVRSLDNKILLRKSSTGLNINSMTEVDIKKSLDNLFYDLLESTLKIKDCKYILVSTAGVSNKRTKRLVEEIIRDYGYASCIEVVGDHMGALYGAFEGKEGIILISGTGSICYGKNHSGEYIRSGGYGHLIDDEGSAYAIGRDILKAVIRSYDMRGSDTILSNLLYEHLDRTPQETKYRKEKSNKDIRKTELEFIEDIIEFTYKKSTKKEIAALAPLLKKGIEEGDLPSMEIANKVVDELYSLVHTVRKQMKGYERNIIPVTYIGGVLEHVDYIRDGLSQLIQKSELGLYIQKASLDSASGACLIALEKANQKEDMGCKIC